MTDLDESLGKSEPPKKFVKTQLIVLDLDETLICSDDEKIDNCDYYFEVDNTKIWGRKRPHLEYFLRQLDDIANIGFWSASSKPYINQVLKTILPSNIVPILIMDIESCSSKWNYDLCSLPQTTKPLKKIWRKGIFNRFNTLVVDDTPTTYSENYGNAIPIKGFDGSPNDKELLLTLDKIKQRFLTDDCRIITK